MDVEPPPMPVDPRPGRRGAGRAGKLALEAPGAEELSIIGWPLLLRRRYVERVSASHRYPLLVLATVLSGLFAVNFTITLLAVSLPTIAEDVGASETTLTWVITGPLLAFGVV